MPKIALAKVKELYLDSYESCVEIVQSISEWTEVTEEELSLLRKHMRSIRGYEEIHIIEWVPTEKIRLAVADCIKAAQKEKERLIEAKKKAEETKRQKELKKRAKTEAQEKKLFEELQKKYQPNQEEVK